MISITVLLLTSVQCVESSSSGGCSRYKCLTVEIIFTFRSVFSAIEREGAVLLFSVD